VSLPGGGSCTSIVNDWMPDRLKVYDWRKCPPIPRSRCSSYRSGDVVSPS
jgi:hypothetical protein